MAHAVLHADQAQPVRRIARGAKHGAAGMGVEPIPWRASKARRRQRWKPKGRDATGGSMRSTIARPGIAGGRTNAFNAGAQVHEHAEPFLRISVKLQNRKSVEAALCPSTDTDARFHGIPYSANQRFSA